MHVPNLSNRYFHSVVPLIFLHREETDLTALVNNFRWRANLREHESAMASSIDPCTERATIGECLLSQSPTHGESGDRARGSEPFPIDAHRKARRLRLCLDLHDPPLSLWPANPGCQQHTIQYVVGFKMACNPHIQEQVTTDLLRTLKLPNCGALSYPWCC